MHTKEENTPHRTGTVEWYDAEHGVGAICPDDASLPCVVHAATLRDCGLDTLSPGDRVRFRMREDGAERTATDLALLLAEQIRNDFAHEPALHVPTVFPEHSARRVLTLERPPRSSSQHDLKFF